MRHAELELTLRAAGDGYTADLRFHAPASAADSDLALAVPVSFDLINLQALSNDWSAYGHTISAQLFADPRMQVAWAKAQAYTERDNTPLRLRLRIDPGADALHALRWELLQDPTTGGFLCRSERILLARYLDTRNLAPITSVHRATLRALVAIASPSDLEEYNLTPVDVAGEVTRARAALGGLPSTLLAGPPHGQGATLEALVDALRAGHLLLSLVCHGSMVKGQPILWLEKQDGSCDRVAGATLVQRIADLDPSQRPLLIILAACQTAGRDQHAEVLTALGPQLARAGVGAVIGMQGNAPMQLIATLLPRLLSELRKDGQIDRALALARAALPDDQPWWMPALFMRVRDGRLWAAEAAEPDLLPHVVAGIDALIALLRSPPVRPIVAAFRSDFSAARTQVADVIALKDVHDLLHSLQFQCYIPLTASRDGTARQHFVHSADLRVAAMCQARRGLTDEEVKRFQVPTPLAFDFEHRECPPVYSWQR